MSDNDHGKALEETGFWGRQGAGAVIVARDTGRILLPHRSAHVEQPHTWGTWGGAIDAGEKPHLAAGREIQEEMGYDGPVDLHHVWTFKHPSGFQYHNFIGVVDHEFTPNLNWETQKHRWVTPGEWPQPLHFGLAGLLERPEFQQTLDRIRGEAQPKRTRMRKAEGERPKFWPTKYTRHPNTEFVSVDTLWPYREFDRDDQATIQRLAEEFKTHGVLTPLRLTYYSKDDRAILGEGNHRIAAAKLAGLKEVPLVVSRTQGASTEFYDPRGARRPAIAVPKVPVKKDGYYVPADLSPSHLGIPSRPMTPEEAAMHDRAVEAKLGKAEGDGPRKLYHLTDKADFKLDPNYEPANNTTLGGTLGKGIYLTPDVEHWVNGYGYWRPWVVEFDAPHDLHAQPGVLGGKPGFSYGGELMVPPQHYDKLRISRVMPLDAHAREQFGDYGWTEDWAGKTFDNKPLEGTGHARQPAYRFEGDVREWPAAQRKEYARRVEKFRKTRTNAIAKSDKMPACPKCHAKDVKVALIGEPVYECQECKHHWDFPFPPGLENSSDIDTELSDGRKVTKEMVKSEVEDHAHGAVCVMVQDGFGRTLWGRRRKDNRYTMPAGHIDAHESPVDAALRELHEEAGLVPRVMWYVGAGNGPEGPVYVYHALASGAPTNLNDPDREMAGWEWHDCLLGPPEHVTANLAHNPNVVYALMGWKQPQSMMKAEKTWSFDPEMVDEPKQYFEGGAADPHWQEEWESEQPVLVPLEQVRAFTDDPERRRACGVSRHGQKGDPKYPMGRPESCDEYIDAMAEAMKQGTKFPPLLLERKVDGSFGTPDGNHRIQAARRAGLTHVPAIIKRRKKDFLGKAERDYDEETGQPKPFEWEEKHPIPHFKDHAVHGAGWKWQNTQEIGGQKWWDVSDDELHAQRIEDFRKPENQQVLHDVAQGLIETVGSVYPHGYRYTEHAPAKDPADRATYNWEGHISMHNPRDLGQISRIFGDLDISDSPLEDVDALKSWVHEAMHAASNRHTYRTHDQRSIEEATTEILAQHYTPQVLKHALNVDRLRRGNFDEPLFKLDWYANRGTDKKGPIVPKVTLNRPTSYADYVTKFGRLIAHMEGLDEPMTPPPEDDEDAQRKYYQEMDRREEKLNHMVVWHAHNVKRIGGDFERRMYLTEQMLHKKLGLTKPTPESMQIYAAAHGRMTMGHSYYAARNKLFDHLWEHINGGKLEREGFMHQSREVPTHNEFNMMLADAKRSAGESANIRGYDPHAKLLQFLKDPMEQDWFETSGPEE